MFKIVQRIHTKGSSVDNSVAIDSNNGLELYHCQNGLSIEVSPKAFLFLLNSLFCDFG